MWEESRSKKVQGAGRKFKRKRGAHFRGEIRVQLLLQLNKFVGYN